MFAHAGRGARQARRVWAVARLVIVSALLASSFATAGAPTANAWDSVKWTSNSHEAITDAAIADILADPSLPADFRAWVDANQETLSDWSTSGFFSKLGEAVHGVQRPMVPPDLASCDPGADREDAAVGPARWSVGNNPGASNPEYWWQTAVCLERAGDEQGAIEVLGQLIHLIADQGCPPHADYMMHGFLYGEQNFEVFSYSSAFDDSYYKDPSSILYPGGKNVLDIDNHGDGERATFYIPIQNTTWTPIALAPRNADDPYPTRLQVTSPTSIRLDVAVSKLVARPVVWMKAVYEKADGTLGTKEAELQLKYWPWTHWDISDSFAPNGRLWLWFKRTEHGNITSTGEVQVYVNDSKDVTQEVAKPDLRHPWEYYDWLREWTQWAMTSPYWAQYYSGLDSRGPLKFDIIWETAPNTERALLSLQWRMSSLVVEWVLQDAYQRLKDPSYSVADAGGNGYRATFFDDTNWNSASEESPENIWSYTIDCERYADRTCGSFVQPLPIGDQKPMVGDGLFTPCGTGDKVTMKANDLGSFMGGKISSLEVRNGTVVLFSGTALSGDSRTYSADAASLGDFDNRARSARIIPAGVTAYPTAFDDAAKTPLGDAVTVDVLGNDAYDGDVTIRAHHASSGTVAVSDGKVVYTPNAGWSGKDRFSYDVVYANGVCDTASVAVQVGGVNHSPRDVNVVTMQGDAAVTEIDEGQTVNAFGTFVDEDSDDAHTIDIAWGDGTAASHVSLPAGTFEFSVNHTYADNPASGVPYTITATVTDPAHASAAGTANLAVRNVAPSVTIQSVAGGRPFVPVGIAVPISAGFTDPGSLDTHTASVDWGDGIVQPLGPVTRPGFAGSHPYMRAGIFNGAVAVTDKDGGVGTAAFSVEVLSATDSADRLAAILTDMLPGADPATANLLRQAIDALGSNKAGSASNGASAKLAAGSRVAALVKLAMAEKALRQVTSRDVSAVRLLIVQIAQSVAESSAREARETTGCVALDAPTCSIGEQTATRTIDRLLAEASAATARRDYLGAIAAYQDATQRAVANAH